MREDYPINQQSLLEHVSTLLKGFKSLLKTVQETARQMVSDEDYTPHLKQLLITTKELQESAVAIDYVLPTSNDIESIFLRIVNRLNEHISNASKPTSVYNGSGFIDKLFVKLQDCIKTAKISRNIGGLFSSIFAIFKQFSIVAEKFYYGEPLPEDSTFVERITTNASTHFSANQQHASPPPQPPKESQYQKVMNVLNCYYSGLNCLDLDFPAFKSFYFQTRTETQQKLVEQMVQHNGIITRAVTFYNKRFQDFQRKKQRNELRKIKLTSLQDIQPKPSPCRKQRHSVMSNYQRKQTDRKDVISEYHGKSQQLVVQTKDPQDKSPRQQTKDNDSSCKKKTSYQIKNVYLTFRKPPKPERGINFYNFHEVPILCKPIDLSKTIEQNQVVRKQKNSIQKHLKLSPVKLNGFERLGMKQYLLQQVQTLKNTNRRPIRVIHHLKKPKSKEPQNKSIKVSSFGQKLSRQLRIRGQEKVLKTLEKASPFLLNNDITL